MSTALLVFESNMKNQDSVYESLQRKINDMLCNLLMHRQIITMCRCNIYKIRSNLLN